ncbi:MAG TPA: hypothetical protein VIS49_01515 [Cyclobacteriaceae bacterium]
MITKLTSMIMAVLLAGTIVMGQEQEKAQVYRLTFHDVIKGKNADFEKAVKAKTEKFNKASVDAINTWRVMSGPRTGQYARVSGPKDWTYFESGNDAGRQNWVDTVVPFIEKSSGVEYSVRQKDMSYNGSGKTTLPKYVDIWEFTLQAESNYEWTSFVRDLVRICNENKSKSRFNTYEMVSGTNMGKYLIVWGMDSLAEMDDNSENWPQWFNKMKGSSAAWGSELRRVSSAVEIYGQTRYMMQHMPDLSSK